MFTSLSVWVRSNVISVFVCLSVYLFVFPLAYLKKLHVQISLNFLCMLNVAVARSSSDGKAVLSLLLMTSCFHVMDRMGRIGDDAHVSSSSPRGGTGTKSAVSDCILFYIKTCMKSINDDSVFRIGRWPECVVNCTHYQFIMTFVSWNVFHLMSPSNPMRFDGRRKSSLPASQIILHTNWWTSGSC